MKSYLQVMQALIASIVVTLPSAAAADGGSIAHVERSQGLIVTVYAAPNPLQAGPIDFSVLVQEEASLQVVEDAEISVTCRLEGGIEKNEIDPKDLQNALIIATAATRKQATNKLLQSAIVDLPSNGEWHVEIAVKADGLPLDFYFPISVVGTIPPSRWDIAFVVPLVGVVFFALHRYLANRRPSVQRLAS